MVAGSFHRKCDRPRYRFTSWLRAGGWLREGRACEQRPRAGPHVPAGGCGGLPGCSACSLHPPEFPSHRDGARERSPGLRALPASGGERGALGCRPPAPGAPRPQTGVLAPAVGDSPAADATCGSTHWEQAPPGAHTSIGPWGALQSSPYLGVGSEEAVAGHGGVRPHAAVLQQGHQNCGREQRPRVTRGLPSPGGAGRGRHAPPGNMVRACCSSTDALSRAHASSCSGKSAC